MSSPTLRRPGLDSVLLSVLALGTFALLMVFRATEQTGDSMAYAIAAQTGERLFHPHHLLYSPIVRVLYLALSTVSDAIDAILAAQIHNAIWAAVAVASVTATLRRMGVSRVSAAAGGLTLLACQGFLLFSTMAEVYVPATACSALLFLLMARAQEGDDDSPWWPAALLLALMIFYHQTTVLFSVPLFVFWWLRGRPVTGVRIVGAAGVLTLGTYIGVVIARTGTLSFSGLVNFTLRYAVRDHEHWGSSGNVNSGDLLTMLDQQVWNIVSLPSSGMAVARVLLALLLAAIAVRAAMVIRSGQSGGPLQGTLAASLLVHASFFLWWQPEQKEFFVISLVPLILMTMVVAGNSTIGRWATTVGALLFAAIALPVHVAETLRPLQAPERDEVAQAKELLEAAPEGCGFYAPRLVIYSLRYDFGVQASQVRVARRIRRRRALAEDPNSLSSPLKTDCVALPYEQLDPTHPTTGGAAKPVAWWTYARAVLRVQESPGGEVTFPELNVVQGKRGSLYFVQNGPPVTVSGIEAFCRWMDDRLQADTGQQQIPFTIWFKSSRARFPRGATSP